MKLAFLHLSDFHVKDGDFILSDKRQGIINAVASVGKFDELVIVFSGDLAFSGQPNQYKKCRHIFGPIISKLKELVDGKFITLMMVPGNHDLDLSNSKRAKKIFKVGMNLTQLKTTWRMRSICLTIFMITHKRMEMLPMIK